MEIRKRTMPIIEHNLNCAQRLASGTRKRFTAWDKLASGATRITQQGAGA